MIVDSFTRFSSYSIKYCASHPTQGYRQVCAGSSRYQKYPGEPLSNYLYRDPYIMAAQGSRKKRKSFQFS